MKRCLAVLVLLVPSWLPTAVSADPIPEGAVAQNVRAIGYSELGGRPAFKMAIRELSGRWYLYVTHFWTPGWSVVDVTDPADPTVAKFLPWDKNAYTWQIDLAGDRMITGLEALRSFPNFGRAGPSDEGVLIWSIANPVEPRLLGQFRTGAGGTHRNFYAGGRYMHLAAGMPGYDGNIYVIVDIADPTNPKEAGRWWVPGQHVAGGEQPDRVLQRGETAPGAFVSLHGPPYVVGDLAYLPYGAAGMIVLDISEPTRPRQIGRLPFSPPFHSVFGVHTVLPLPEQGIAYINSEDVSYGRGPANFAGIVDIADPARPTLLSLLPQPQPPVGASYGSFAEKGGWSGPHNANLLQHNPDVQKQGDLFYLAHFNAGLRVYDVSNRRNPREAGFFLPPEPRRRFGPMPQGPLVTQSEDVLVDRRGLIYVTDKNQGLWVLQYTGPVPAPPSGRQQ